MKLELKRIYKADTYTIGKLYIDGEYFCDTIEDKDRGLSSDMSEDDIKKIKVYAETAIPCGIYKVTLNVVSPKFVQKQFYKDFCGGKVPRLLNVLGFDGILIHIGSTAKSSAGCIIVGENKVKGGVINSEVTFKKLYKKLKAAKDEITIEFS